LFSLSGIAMVFVQSITLLIVLRTIQGFGASACMSMGRAIVNDVFERQEAAKQMSTIAMGLSIAPIVSLAFGGVIAESAGLQGAMVLLSFCGVVLFICAYRLLDETNLNRATSINFELLTKAYLSVLRSKVFLGWAIAGGMQIGIFFSLNAFLAYQYQKHGYSMSEFGAWFALTPLCYLLGNTANRNWFVKRGIEMAALIGCVLGMLALITLYITQAMGMTHALSLALPCCLFGFSNGIIVANSTIGAISASGKHTGTGSGIVGAWQMATGGIAGAIIVALGGAQLFSVAAGTLIVMSLIAVIAMTFIFKWSRQSISE